MIKWVGIVLILLNCIYARGPAKTDDMYGDGDVLANSYCKYVGLDCSSTCCIQQKCASSLTDCEYGISTEMLYMYYVAAGAIGLIILFPICVKIISFINSIEFRKSRRSAESSKDKTKEKSFKKGKSKIIFQSQIMKKLERNHFSIDQSLDIEYLKPMEDHDEINNLYDRHDFISFIFVCINTANNDSLSYDYPIHDTERNGTKGHLFGSGKEKNVISNKPYKNNESTNKDEISGDSEGDSLEMTNQRLKLDTLKTMTPIEPIPSTRRNKNNGNFPTINEDNISYPVNHNLKSHKEDSKSNAFESMEAQMMDEVLKEHEEQNEEERRSRILRNSKANESYNKSNKSKDTKALSNPPHNEDENINEFEMNL